MKKINNLISTFRLENSLKNILIFFPLVFSNREFLLNDILKLTFGVLIFTIMTSICYVTNDYTDRFKDKINKLKSLKKILNKKSVIFLNIFLFFFIAYLYKFTDLFNFYLILYLLFFYLYNFICKKIFLLDILFLISFYIIRIFYGAEMLQIVISYWFLIFFTTIFIILSTFKRMIQISVNNLTTEKNNIINYSYKDYTLFKNIIIISSIINFLIFAFYLYEIISPNTFNIFYSPETLYQQNIFVLVLVFLLYFFWLIRLIKLVLNEKIKKDIYIFILKDKISYFSFVFPALLYIFIKYFFI